MELNAKSCTALEAIAEGHSYEQILAANPHLTYKDIFAAAAEALDLLDSPASKKSPLSYEERMAEIREEHPRAYEPWSKEEDADLKRYFDCSTPAKQIAQTLQRQPGAIRSRLRKLNLVQ